jgi:hypothetical protein
MDTIKLLVKDQYGRTVFHPDNEAARHLAAIAGTKTLTPDAIKHIEALGFNIAYTRRDSL